MKITTEDGNSFDTERDLSAQERHVLQKLFLWKSMARNLQEFRDEKRKALRKGWNNSGAITAGPALESIIKDLEKAVVRRIETRTSRT